MNCCCAKTAGERKAMRANRRIMIGPGYRFWMGCCAGELARGEIARGRVGEGRDESRPSRHECLRHSIGSSLYNTVMLVTGLMRSGFPASDEQVDEGQPCSFGTLQLAK